MSNATRALALALALVAAGCTTPAGDPTPLEAASIDGEIVIGDAFVLKGARLSVAPANAGAEGTPGRAVPLEDPPWTARTAMLRDHWVLEAVFEERTPAAGSGVHRVRLDWSGELAGEVYVEGPRRACDASGSSAEACGRNATRPLGVIARFDLGPSIESSNVYAFEITSMP